MYSKNVKKWLVPFLRQCERKTAGAYNSLLRDYIVTMAKTDLARPLKVFELSKAHVSVSFIWDTGILYHLDILFFENFNAWIIFNEII